MKVTYIEKKKIPFGQTVRHILSNLLRLIGFFGLAISVFSYLYSFIAKVTIQEIYTVNFVISSIAVSRYIISKWSKESLKALFFILINILFFNPFAPIYWGKLSTFLILCYFIYDLKYFYEFLGIGETKS